MNQEDIKTRIIHTPSSPAAPWEQMGKGSSRPVGENVKRSPGERLKNQNSDLLINWKQQQSGPKQAVQAEV